MAFAASRCCESQLFELLIEAASITNSSDRIDSKPAASIEAGSL
jgi:hypothetical protein